MQGERSRELAGPDVWQTCRELIPAGSVFAFLAEHREAIAGHPREIAAERGGLPRFDGISRQDLPAGNTIA
jgi:hypothetical protein